MNEPLDPLYDVSVIKRELDQATDKDLVAFDVDYVLITPSDKVLQPCGEWLVEQWMKKHELDKDQELRETLISIVMKSRRAEVVNAELAAIIKRLVSKGVKIMAVTSVPTGRYGVIPSIENWRVRDLLSFGYDFSYGWSLENFYIQGASGKNPVFKKGILFTDFQDKGPCTIDFLKTISFNPNKIYFIDDMLKHHDSLKQAAERQKIGFRGFLYQELYKKNNDFNPDIGNKQMELLYEKHVWLSQDKLLGP